MNIAAALALAASVSSMGPPADTADHSYQLIAVPPGAQEFGFVDAQSFERTTQSVTYWWLTVYEPAAVIQDSPPVLYQMRQRVADCSGRRTKDLMVVARLQNGDERWISLIGHFRPVRPGAVGESELEFACEGKLPQPGLPAFATLESAVQFADAARRRATAAAAALDTALHK